MIQLSKSIINGNNRYNDMLPCKKIIKLSKIFLDSYNNPLILGEDSSNINIEESYINASCLDGGPLEKDSGMFIATQGPLKKTISKFWKLVIQKGVCMIIMLCKEQEDLRVRFY
jgi:protein tyrosine phosphatase